MKRKKEHKPENSERWLLTYADMITLLVVLFVVLYALSNVDLEKYKELAKSLNGAMGSGTKSESVLSGASGILDGGNSILSNSSDSATKDTTAQEDVAAAEATQMLETTETGAADGTAIIAGEKDETSTSADMSDGTAAQSEAGIFKKLETDVMDHLGNSDIKENVFITTEDRGLVISFTDNIFFDSGKASIKDEMKGHIDEIAAILNTIPNDILIEGHTDNIPIHNKNFSSNWQLSATRAANVAQYMVEMDALDPVRLTAAGCGEYQPVTSNDTEEGRQKNRRINVVILYEFADK